MKSIFSKLVLMVATVLLAGGIEAGAAEPQAKTPAELRVGIAPVSPPMIFKEGKTVTGIEADLAQALGRELGRPVKFVELPFEDLVDALAEGKIDIIMSGMSITRARQFRIAFCDPFLRVGQMPLVRANEQYRYVGLQAALAKQTIGVKRGTTGDLLVQQEFPKAKRKYFKTGEEAAEALSKKRIDLFISDSHLVSYLAGLNEAKGLVTAPMVLSDEALAWGVRRSDDPLRVAANDFLKKALKDGELDKILRRWVPLLK